VLDAFKAKSERLREMRIHRRTDLTLDDMTRRRSGSNADR
jgi:hypothetical protein